MSDTQPAGSYTCPYCRQPSDGSALRCPNCGAPVDITLVRDDSGWTMLPPIPAMTRVQFGRTVCQITGEQSPVVDVALSGDETVYFSHHVVLYRDATVELEAMPMSGAWNRTLAGMPLVMVQASGPGHLAVSEDACGELVAVPLEDGQGVQAREHRFLLATANIDYTWTKSGISYTTSSGSDTEYHRPLGRYLDEFTADGAGLLLLHAPGNVLFRDLAEGESFMIQPGSLVYKDATVEMELTFVKPPGAHSLQGQPFQPLLAVRGPGRVAISTVFGTEDADGGFVYMNPVLGQPGQSVWKRAADLLS